MSNSKNTTTPAKGEKMEEILRRYFISSGFFCVRGIRYEYGGDEITDIDLWLYSKSSILSRQRINVDIKNKKKTGTRERIVWAKGINKMLNLDSCIVATTDDSPILRLFGREHGVVIIGKEFLKKLEDRETKEEIKRISEEDLEHIIQPRTIEKGGYNEFWYKRIKSVRTRLLSSLDFSGLNATLEDLRYFLEYTMFDSPSKEAAIRAFYVCASHFLIITDYLQQQILFLNDEQKQHFFKEGFMYGKDGKSSITKFVEVSKQLSLLKEESSFEYTIEKALAAQPFDILVEYISKTSVLRDAFELAKKFDFSAYNKVPESVKKLQTDQINFVYTLADFFSIDRRKIPFVVAS